VGAGERDAKQVARDGALERRRDIDEGRRRDLSERIAIRALAFLGDAPMRGVLGYAATPDEVDAAPLLRALRERGARVAYPRVCGPGALTLHWADEDGLAAGYCGIAEPAEDAPAADPRDLDVVIVPGVAFDLVCCRLGHGGGFYDRLLREMPHASTIGLAFDEQIVEALPSEAHDVHLGVVVTPTRLLVRRLA
jgi:5-formyltetrahydrofolate cyclo-ligase